MADSQDQADLDMFRSSNSSTLLMASSESLMDLLANVESESLLEGSLDLFNSVLVFSCLP